MLPESNKSDAPESHWVSPASRAGRLTVFPAPVDARSRSAN
jgi:hypothetical protein